MDAIPATPVCNVLTGYLLVVNLVAFVAYGADKRRARQGRWRMQESTLLLVEALGGSLGAWVGMRVWRHKTLHAKFRYGVPLLAATHVGLLVWLLL